MILKLKEALSNSYVFQAQAQSFHWNVVGMFFKPLHDFFGEIYENTHESVDVLAEYLRMNNELAPRSLAEIYSNATIKELEYVPGGAADMIRMLIQNNDVLIGTLNSLMDDALAQNQHAVADYVATRLDTHQKWQWMLRSHLQG